MSKSRIVISIMSFQKCLLVEVELFRYGSFSSTEKIVQIYSTLVYFLDGLERTWCQKIEGGWVMGVKGIQEIKC